METLKKVNLVWSGSLLTIGIITLIINVIPRLGIELPAWSRIVLAVLNMIAVFLLAFTTVWKMKYRK